MELAHAKLSPALVARTTRAEGGMPERQYRAKPQASQATPGSSSRTKRSERPVVLTFQASAISQPWSASGYRAAAMVS